MTLLVGKKAPGFTAAAVMANGEINPNFNLHEAIDGKYGIVFFYPLDFTFVCPSELIALDNRIEEFTSRNALVMGISIDSQFTHNAWRNTPVASGGIGQVRYPLIADVNHQICQAYGVEHPTAHVALRGAFIIDKQGIVRSQIVNDLPLGRNVDELLRLIDALEFHEKHGEVCPAGWTKGKTGIKPTSEGIAKFLADEAGQL
ncbi:peroxiredoxin [Aquicella lusitana]|uniref:Thioredoxin peroxidase n=1 Tax=Aquicella lusitana TaxID=254246 RepID=A0A370G6H0_9COXI|nr:peroxiredoxin [Aquicella lusitana]RDI38459.1 peroxiredoxin (alkyl hydroperoxide reductase subunit C) [Aquicella lusitana]VVC73768.1 putative peroxiredoxin [Aquicella lusitana]